MMTSLNIHYFQHVAFEGPGSIEKWAKNNNHRLSSTKFYKDWKLPAIDEIDWLIVMGGPMGVYDEDKFPWLKTEKEFIATAIKNNKTVVGICLGSQLIAEVCGAKVYPNRYKEIGWFPIQLTDQKNDLLQGIPSEFIVFHWHGDTFDLPEGAAHLASTALCRNQAFLLHDKVLGLQFHLEATEKSVQEMLLNGLEEIIPSDSIQSAEEIRSTREFISQNNNALEQFLDKLAAK